MNGLAAPGGGDLHAGHQPHPRDLSLALGFLQAGDRVVVGQREDGDACIPCPSHEVRRAQGAIGTIGMGVKVDMGLAGHERSPASPTASIPRLDRTTKPCWRAKPSLV